MRVLAAFVLAAAFAPAARADGTKSSNWAGYSVTRADGGSFRRVQGAWVQPTVNCTPGKRSYAAVWVGLGGWTADSPALEQIGTDSDCTRSGDARYSAWFELVPDVSHDLTLAVGPGDHMSASVTVTGKRVRLRLANRTTGEVFDRTLRADVVDRSSAEWILETPSLCSGLKLSDCYLGELSDFGSLTFTNTLAQSSGGHTAGILSRRWSANAVAMTNDYATPSNTDGASFSIDYGPIRGSTSFAATSAAATGSGGAT